MLWILCAEFRARFAIAAHAAPSSRGFSGKTHEATALGHVLRPILPGVVPVNQPRLQGQPESSVCLQPVYATTTQHLFAGLSSWPSVWVSQVSPTVPAVPVQVPSPRILPCFRAVVGAVLRRRRCVEHGALDRFQFQWSAAAPWDVTLRTAGRSLTQFCSSQMRESGGWRHSSSSISSFATVATAYPARGLGAVAFFLGRNSSRFRRHEEVHAILPNTLPSHDDDAFGFQSDVTS